MSLDAYTAGLIADVDRFTLAESVILRKAPDNEVALAMVRHDLQRAKDRLAYHLVAREKRKAESCDGARSGTYIDGRRVA